MRWACLLLVAFGVACGDDDPGPGGEACPGLGELDCGECADAELCWYTRDLDGCVSGGCMDYPAPCTADRTCACVDATVTSTTSNPACDAVGFEQSSNACEVRGGRPVLFCVSTLG